MNSKHNLNFFHNAIMGYHQISLTAFLTFVIAILSSPSNFHVLFCRSQVLAQTPSFPKADGPFTQDIKQQTPTNSQDATRAAANKLYEQGESLFHQGTAESRQQALLKFTQALKLDHQTTHGKATTVGDRIKQGRTLSYIGKIYLFLEKNQKALDYLNQALTLSQQTKDNKQTANILADIGVIYSLIGEEQKALNYYNQALPLSQRVGDNQETAFILTEIGKIYSDLGTEQKAIDYFNQSLDLTQKLEVKSLQAMILDDMGFAYILSGQPQKGLDYLIKQSLPISKHIEDKTLESSTLSHIGYTYEDVGNWQQALNYYKQSLVLSQKMEDNRGIATALHNLGTVYDQLGDGNKALDYFNKAVPLIRQVQDKAGEVANFGSIAHLEHRIGNEDLALANVQKAIAIQEQLRTNTTAPEFRTSYFTTIQNYHNLYKNILMQLHKQHPSQGYDAQALQVSERDHARSLLELLANAHVNIHQGANPKLLSQEQELQQQLDTLEQRRVQILSDRHTEAEAQAIKKQIETILEKYQQVEEQIRATSPHYATLKQPQPLSLSQIQQQVLDDNTLLLEYSLGEEHSYLWAVTNKTLTSYELPKQADIDAAANSFYQDLKRPIGANQRLVTKDANTLAQMILAPVARQLGQRRLLVVGDGALQYIPFAALPTPQSSGSKYQPLIVDHEIINLPSASTLAILRQDDKQRQKAAKTLIAFADPVFSRDDERLKGKVMDKIIYPSFPSLARDEDINFARLLYTRQEAENILSLVPINQRQQELDFDASRATVLNTDLSQYRIVHFATKGIFDKEHPEFSGLVLSLFNNQGKPLNGFLRLHDIFNLHLSADLVVLSGCETGLGEDVKGEGLVGLTRGFMYAGTPRVVASLWNVDDEATSELMKAFYQKMLQSGMKPGAALRAAQLEMWHNQQYTLPYYWAAFTLQGEW